MIKDRNVDEENMLIRIGLDGGGGFSKYVSPFLI